MSTIRRSRGGSVWVAIAMLGATAVGGTASAACGTTGAPSGTVTNASNGPNPAFLKFAKCMRANGVPNMPDSGQISAGSGINPSTPAFQGAMQVCKKQLPGGGPPAHASEQQKEQLVATAECMRAHGVSTFPDPITSTAPPRNLQDYSIAERMADLQLLVPNTIDLNSPAFKQAGNACNFH